MVLYIFDNERLLLRWLPRLIGLMLLLVIAPANADTPNCLYNLGGISGASSFQNFPVTADQILYPAKPVLSSSEAMMFRTVIRAAAKEGPDFAGHYKVAIWGCGSSCSFAAIIDEKSGRVYVDSRLNDVSAVYVLNEDDAGPNSFRFQRNSRLLIVLGAPNEDESGDGISFYEWTGLKLHLLRYIPGTSACVRPLP